jgi:single-strand DNA-binding protein
MAVSDIGLAVNRSWYDKSANERKEETTFVDVTLWGRTAEVAGEYLSKGRSILIEGYLKTDSWDDKETGKKRTKLKVIAEVLQMLGGPREGGSGGGRSGGGGGGASRAPSNAAPAPVDDAADAGFGDEVPF